jgi:CheY-like chemotaxis protein
MSIDPPTILIVDNEPDMSLLVRRLILSFAPRCEIVMVTSGAQALAVLVARPVALVITDYHMPGMNGVQLTRAIKGKSPLTRVAIMTAEDVRDITPHAHAVAADYVLPKPYELAHLQLIIGESLPPAARAPG